MRRAVHPPSSVLRVLSPFGDLAHGVPSAAGRTLCGRDCDGWQIVIGGFAAKDGGCAPCLEGLRRWTIEGYEYVDKHTCGCVVAQLSVGLSLVRFVAVPCKEDMPDPLAELLAYVRSLAFRGLDAAERVRLARRMMGRVLPPLGAAHNRDVVQALVARDLIEFPPERTK